MEKKPKNLKELKEFLGFNYMDTKNFLYQKLRVFINQYHKMIYSKNLWIKK